MKNNKKGFVAIALGIVAVVGSLIAIINIQSKGTYAYKSYTITFRGAEDYELCGGLTCVTGPDGTIANCTASYSGVCRAWSDRPCNYNGATGLCEKNTGQSLAITSNNIAGHVYTEDTTYYCYAGTSITPKNCDGPRPSSSIPSSSSSSTPSSSSSTPSSSSSTPSSSTPSSSEPVNPPTGTTAIYMVWVIGLGALIYAMVYFRKMKVR